MLKSLLSLFFQSNCPLCQRSTAEILCKYCQRQLQNYEQKNPSQFWCGELPLFVWGKYEGQLKRAIATLKYNNRPEIAELLGSWLADAWIDSSLYKGKLTVVPIPLHQDKLRQRGFNQASVIARSFCDRTGYLRRDRGLARIRTTRAMFGLSPSERAKNLKNAFALGEDFQNRLPTLPVLLIDDIYTTGNTVGEAARLLRQRGIAVFGVAALSSPKN